ncbi:MAG: hypothetical protein HY698_00475 [Deltaproteobacteria bacterium]|nr:hypothetical protein [Deltaproteobacteria bacterium]
MRRFRTTKGMIIAASLALLGAAACSKGGKGGVGGGATLAAASPVTVLPKETGFVVGLSLNKLRGTKLFDKLAAKAKEQEKEKYDELKAKCGVDVFQDFESLTIAGDAKLDEKKLVFLLKGKFDEEKGNKCVQASAEKEGKKLTIKKDGKLTEYAVEGESESLYAAWLGTGAVLVGPNKEYVTAVADRKSSLKDNGAFMDLVKQVDQGASAWGVFTAPAGGEPSGPFGELVSDGENAQGLFMTVNYTKDLDAKVGIRYPSDKGAKGIVDKVNQAVTEIKANPMFGGFLTGFKAEVTAKDGLLSLKLTEQQLDMIAGFVESQIPMGMMGGGMGAHPGAPGIAAPPPGMDVPGMGAPGAPAGGVPQGGQ